ncbi:Gfo/Idh/MocA family protein [Planomonospora parontospora]|uniref:Gfo/Idh/MocA family protein n=1 Tax=Planomonospora parontospora TaxID=58119 RepID=UPI00167120D5|nr:Gfo/Idh/MocA family oxidoreductase [Planomonospora parontospora]GGL07209.1 dehydrogenase [Planomonospora parontospora subsp. antibiotica]GII14117.1 dehydrogenase [Planomonospora parontospora subsp. antibiotica]
MRYAFVGLGHRAQMYVDALLGDWRDTGTIVALCDTNRTRMDYYAERIGEKVPCFAPDDFAEMLELCDAVVVATVDATHAHYVVTALDAGKRVIVEKPLTIDAEGCAAIAAAAERSTGSLVVTFNYRYSPRNSAVRRLIMEGAIGEVTSVHFDWALDTIHGADYFRRWHRDKVNSGGLLVHKSTHHFDLVNWWLDAAAQSVYAQGELRFYGAENARARELDARPERGQGAPGLGSDPFILDISADPRLKRLYLDAEHEDGYIRDQDVFTEGVTIEDNMSVLVRYDNRALLTYSLNAHAPSEGYRVVFNGTGGRIELEVCERAWTPPHAAIDPTAASKEHATGAWERLTLHQHWQEAREIPIEQGEGGHGGGDRLLLDDVFRGPGGDPLARQAGYLDGIRSVMVGASANESIRTGRPIRLVDGGTRMADS